MFFDDFLLTSRLLSTLRKNYPFLPIYSISYLYHGYLLYSMVYKPLLASIIFFKLSPIWPMKATNWLLCPLTYASPPHSSFYDFYEDFLTLASHDVPGSFSNFPGPAWNQSFLRRVLVPFTRMVFRNHYLSTRCAHCY